MIDWLLLHRVRTKRAAPSDALWMRVQSSRCLPPNSINYFLHTVSIHAHPPALFLQSASTVSRTRTRCRVFLPTAASILLVVTFARTRVLLRLHIVLAMFGKAIPSSCLVVLIFNLAFVNALASTSAGCNYERNHAATAARKARSHIDMRCNSRPRHVPSCLWWLAIIYESEDGPYANAAPKTTTAYDPTDPIAHP